MGGKTGKLSTIPCPSFLVSLKLGIRAYLAYYFTWTEWKQKLIESFPQSENYAELLHKMLAKTVRYGESFEHYYHAKMNLLNRCKIYGKEVVDCLLYGVEDRAVKVGAQAAQFKQPEQVLKYFRTVKVGKVRDSINDANLKKNKSIWHEQGGP